MSVTPPKPSDAESGHYYDVLVTFLQTSDKEYLFSGLNSNQRRKVHEIAEKFHLYHKSIPSKHGKDVSIKKITEKEFQAQKRKHAKTTCPSPKTTAVKLPAVPRPQNDADAESYYDMIVKFMQSSSTNTIFSALDGLQRKKVHQLAEAFKLLHESSGRGSSKIVTLSKISPQEYNERKQKEATFRAIVKSFREMAKQSQDAFSSQKHGIPTVYDRSCLRDHIRYCSWNIEWMDYFFKDDKTFHTANAKNDIKDVDALCKKIALAIDEMNPDVLTILEGPGCMERMELFQKTYLNDSFQCFGGFDGGSQRIYILVKKESVVKNPSYYDPGNDYLSQHWYFDVSGSMELSEYNFIRRPVIIRAEVEVDHEAKPIFFVGVHAKSKYVNRGEHMWKGTESEKRQYIQKSISNRRKIGAECGRIRKCLEQTAFTEYNRPMVIVSGDMNDGPGMDFFEEFYMLFDSVDILMGNQFTRKTMLYPILNQPHFVAPEDQYSCVFNDYVDDIKNKKVMLDHIFVSEILHTVTIQAAFAHNVWDKYATGQTGYRPRDEYLSDHRPVFADFAISAIQTTSLNDSDWV